MDLALSEVFDIRYGHSLELNALEISTPKDGVAFVSRQMGENGISAYVSPVDDLDPAQAGEITCALSGNGVLTTYVQEGPFYTGFHVAILRPKIPLTKQQQIFYCLCIKSNRFRYNYGRQANKTLPTLLVPTVDEIPDWVNATELDQISGANAAKSAVPTPQIMPKHWHGFRYDALFEIKKGKRLTKANMRPGSTPFISALDSNNGLRQRVSVAPMHPANVITVNYDGNGVAEAFYQPEPFFALDDVNVFYPKFTLNPYIAMFLCALIRREKFRYNYGRKWHLDRMNETTMRLPGTSSGDPDWKFMESYIKSLPYSKSI